MDMQCPGRQMGKISLYGRYLIEYPPSSPPPATNVLLDAMALAQTLPWSQPSLATHFPLFARV